MYSKHNNTRSSGQFNSSAQFVCGDERQVQPPQLSQQSYQSQQPQPALQPQPAQSPYSGAPPCPEQAVPDNVMSLNEQTSQNYDAGVNNEEDATSSHNDDTRPAWMKAKLAGVKKISNKERRRRQNESLRRLLTPKNALMVLNEMLPNDQLNSQFKVETVSNNNQYVKTHNFCADLTLEGQSYKGFGDNKLTARNAAAEQAIRDLIIKKMDKTISAEASGGEAEDEPLPMIQLASFALHKLFCEWEVEGHKVPQLRPLSAALSESELPLDAEQPPRASRASKKPKTLPPDAELMHPCMLLTYMRPALEYRELAAQGDRPQNMIYTIGLDVDGTTFVGKASNKKEARRAAARTACKTLFGVQFQNQPPTS